MKIPLTLSAGFVVLFACLGGVGCEMHPPSQTIAGYAEKEPAKQAIEKQKSLVPAGANTNAPEYFPAQQQSQ